MDTKKFLEMKKSAGLTYRQIAGHCGVSPRLIQSWAAGLKIPEKHQKTLKRLLRQPAQDLLSDTEIFFRNATRREGEDFLDAQALIIDEWRKRLE